MKKLLLHIGMGKTGTSAIQKSMRRFVRDGNQLIYPKFSADPSHNELMVLLKPHAMQPRTIQSRFPKDNEKYRQFVSSVKQEIEQAIDQAGNLVVSAEYFWDLTDAQINELATLLKVEQFDEVRVLVYLREPVAYYNSYIQQRLKASTKFPQPQDYKINYVNILKRWQKKFGRQLSIKVYQREQLVGESSITDFATQCETLFSIKSSGLGSRQSNANESLTAAGLLSLYEIKRRYFKNSENRYDSDTKRLLSLIREGQTALGLECKPLLRACYQQQVLAANIHELDSLRNEFGIAFSPVDLDIDDRSVSGKANELSELLQMTPCVVIEKNALDQFMIANRFW